MRCSGCLKVDHVRIVADGLRHQIEDLEDSARAQKVLQLLCWPPHADDGAPLLGIACWNHLGHPEVEESGHIPLQQRVLSEALLHSVVKLASQSLDLFLIHQILLPALILHFLLDLLLDSLPLRLKPVGSLLLGSLAALDHPPVLMPLHEHQRVLLLDQYKSGRYDAPSRLNLGETHQRDPLSLETKLRIEFCREDAIVMQGQVHSVVHFERVARHSGVVKLAHRYTYLHSHKDFPQAKLQAEQMVKLGCDCVPAVGELHRILSHDVGH
mmetsp:Transcript_3926/g.11805  ORF Transcript_3926/g.11805 Transcript_3926/m.11805 type:complete len:269 (-) Transcript_3926:675-1481(-)